MEKLLKELVERIESAAGTNLTAVVLYGSAAAGEFHPEYSDLNVLCVVQRLDSAAVAGLGAAARWWAAKGHPAPLLFTAEELRRSADVFAIELMDIREKHRLLYGSDVVSGIEVPRTLHRLQVERELRVHLIRLRQALLTAGDDRKALLALLTRAASSLITLLKHALLALGETPPREKRGIVERAAELFAFD